MNEHDMMFPPGCIEPIEGKTYIQDGWKYRDVPGKMPLTYWEQFLEALGADNYVLLSEAIYEMKDGTYARGQLLIKPCGLINMNKFAVELKANH